MEYQFPSCGIVNVKKKNIIFIAKSTIQNLAIVTSLIIRRNQTFGKRRA